MINEMKKGEDFDSSNLVIFLYKWRKPLFIVMVIALVGSWFFSSPWFITPKYKSTVIMFPASSSSISKSLLNEQSVKGQDITAFGEDDQAEQLLQILNSNRIRDRVMHQFDLMRHYDIDSTSDVKFSNLFKEYDRNITFRRTEFMAVQISVNDKDPQMAADIANTIASLLDSAKNDMMRQRSVKGFQVVEAEYNSMKAEKDKIVDSLITLGSLGVNDVEYQSQVLNQQLAITIMNGNKTAQAALQKKLDVLGKYGGIYMALKNSLEFKTEQLILLETKYKQAKVDAQENLPQKFIVSDAYKAERKSYPIRWLIIMVSTVAALFMSIIVIMVMEKISDFNSHKKFQIGQS
ncbi:MAG: Wzz/FepE/Etk N-terminal domain-containing protein [Bacteroidetes bacterium]|nr:Wzz/FepE/Etk N-terminal domain-containing protein [Bacteroidota bacterium]